MAIRISPSSTPSSSAILKQAVKVQRVRPFSSTATRTPTRRHSNSHSSLTSRRPSFLRGLSTLPTSNSTQNAATSTRATTAESVHRQLAHTRRSISTSQPARIDKSQVVEAEGDMATTQDHVVIDVSGPSIFNSSRVWITRRTRDWSRWRVRWSNNTD